MTHMTHMVTEKQFWLVTIPQEHRLIVKTFLNRDCTMSAWNKAWLTSMGCHLCHRLDRIPCCSFWSICGQGWQQHSWVFGQGCNWKLSDPLPFSSNLYVAIEAMGAMLNIVQMSIWKNIVCLNMLHKWSCSNGDTLCRFLSPGNRPGAKIIRFHF